MMARHAPDTGSLRHHRGGLDQHSRPDRPRAAGLGQPSPLSLLYWRTLVLGPDHTDNQAAFAEWFGLTPLEAAILDVIFGSKEGIGGKTIAHKVKRSWGRVHQMVPNLHKAIPNGIESSKAGGYRLTDHGRDECTKALEAIRG